MPINVIVYLSMMRSGMTVDQLARYVAFNLNMARIRITHINEDLAVRFRKARAIMSYKLQYALAFILSLYKPFRSAMSACGFVIDKK